MDLFDSHCHIQSSDKHTNDVAAEASTRSLWAKAGYPGGDALVGRAAAAGVSRLVVVGCDLPDSRLALDFAAGRDNVWASIGIHPHEAKDCAHDEAELAEFAALATAPKVVAIGECGLDYFYNHSDPATQAAVLRFQLELAQQHGLPLIFHVREALDDFWPIFDDYSTANRPIRGVLHSFTDSQANLEAAVKRGLYIGVNGIATFAKRTAQLDMYRAIPLENLVLETDSPFLTPTPYRGNICEPYHTSVTADFLATLRKQPLSGLATATTANARNLFKV